MRLRPPIGVDRGPISPSARDVLSRLADGTFSVSVERLADAILRSLHDEPEASGGAARCSLRGSLGPQGVTFELTVPGVGVVQGWQIEHFHARPAANEGTELHRTMSICSTMVRGHGGRLQAEAAADGGALVIRFSCRNEAAAPRG